MKKFVILSALWLGVSVALATPAVASQASTGMQVEVLGVYFTPPTDAAAAIVDQHHGDTAIEQPRGNLR